MRRTAKETIVRVQVPPACRDDRLLVYAEGRRMMALHPPESGIVAALKGDPIGYFKAVWAGAGEGWLIGDRVEDQNW
jgi:hypothetical protein